MKKTGVIILNWNGEKLLREFLPIVARTTISDEADLIVADNGSTDGSVAWVRENHPEVKLLAFKENYGFAKGYNKALELTDYRYTVLLNSDVETSDGWLDPLVDYMDSHPHAGAAQPKILSWKERDRFEYAGAAGGYLDVNGYPWCRGRLFESIEKDEGQYDSPDPVPVAWASGAALIVRSEAYRALGGLDENFFAHMEEIDLCCRMHAAGWEVSAITASKVWHVGGASLPQGNPRKVYLNFRNNLLLLHKSLPPRRGRKVLFRRRLYDTLAWGMMMLRSDFKGARAILRAHRDFRRMRKLYTDLPATDTLSPLPGARRNIIIDHYLKRQKK